MGCETELIIEHTKLLSDIEARSKSNTHRLNNQEKMLKSIGEMNTNIQLLAQQSVRQGEDMQEILGILSKHEEKIESIEEKMETKETVARLHGRVDELEKKDGRNAEQMLQRLQWLMITTLVGMAVFGLYHFMGW